MASEKTAYFISDAHLGVFLPSCENREKCLIDFFRQIRETAGCLFILGDLFDFWIEYKNAIRPQYFPVLHELRKLVEFGVTIHYMAGNHDFALGDFLKKNIGIEIHPDFLRITLQGKHLHLQHGDGVTASDRSYRILRKILRNPTNLKLFKLLHPDLGVWLAETCSGSSRLHFRRRYTDIMRRQYIAAAQKISNEGIDIVMFGHTHTPEINLLKAGVYCNIGEWLHRYTYATLENGILKRWEYIPGASPRELPDNSYASAKIGDSKS